jgi:hypothetical protein
MKCRIQMIDDKLTENKKTALIPKLLFPKLCNETRLQVEHLRKNIKLVEATILRECTLLMEYH